MIAGVDGVCCETTKLPASAVAMDTVPVGICRLSQAATSALAIMPPKHQAPLVIPETQLADCTIWIWTHVEAARSRR